MYTNKSSQIMKKKKFIFQFLFFIFQMFLYVHVR